MSSSDFKKMSDEQLERVIASASGGSANHNSASWELQRRHLERAVQKLSKPHWTLIPAFWVGVVTMIVAGLAAYFAFLAIPLEQRPLGVNQRSSNKSTSEQKQQTQSAEPLSPKAKMSPSPTKPSNNRLDSDRQKNQTGQP